MVAQERLLRGEEQTNIEDARFLLSALIQALPTVLSLGLIALFAFPKSRKKNSKSLRIYSKYMASFFILILFVGVATIQNAIVLANLENYLKDDAIILQVCIMLSSIVLFLVPAFLILYLLRISKFEVEDNKLIRLS